MTPVPTWSVENVLCVLDELGAKEASRADYVALLNEWKEKGPSEA